MNNPIGDKDTVVKFPPTRLDCLPTIYRMYDPHPKHRGPGCAYYFILDGSQSGMNRIHKLEKTVLRVPRGPEKEAKQQGMW